MRLEFMERPNEEQALMAIIAVCNLAEGPEKRMMVQQLALLIQKINNPIAVTHEDH